VRYAASLLTGFCLAVVLISSPACGGAACATKFISIGTGGTGGVYYPYGGALARLISEKVPCVQATAEVSNASVDNLKLLQQGKVDIAFTLADALSEAVAGTGPFAGSGSVSNARTLAVLYTNYTHVVIRDGLGVRKIADLRGRVVSVGQPNSGTELLADRILRAAGLDPRKDITRQPLSVAESADAMKDGKIDAFFWSGGVPTAAVEDLAATPGFKLLLVPQDDVLSVLQKQPGGQLYSLAVLKPGSYRGVEREIPTVGVSNLLVASASLDADLVRDVVRTMFENKAALVAAHPEASHLEPLASVDGLPATLHPGALNYYRQVGAMKNP